MTANVPFPPSGGFIEAIRSSCAARRQAADIELPSESIDSFLLTLDQARYARLKDSHGLAGMPLNFSSMLDELNVVSMLALLNFLHCYRIPLHQKTGRGAWQTIRYLVLGAYVSSADGSQPLLSTAGMCAAEVPQIAELINIPLHLERQHPSLPVKIGEVDPVSEEIVEKLVEVFKSTGEVLQEGGYPDLGSFVAQALKDGKGDADYLVEKLVRAFPAFRDMYLIQDQRVYLFKKALFLVFAVHQTFTKANRPAPPFPLPQFTDLPIFSDNVIPTMMVHFKLIDISTSSDSALARGLVPTQKTSSSGDEKLVPGVDLPTASAATIRAAAVAAGEVVAARARELGQEKDAEGKGWLKDMTVSGLDAYLWAVAKDSEELRAIPRLTEMGTVMY